MSAEAVLAVAAAGGIAVVQAAGTDAWSAVRQAVARLLGRGSAEIEEAELRRLDQMQAALREDGDPARLRERWEGVWQTRLELLLESVDADDRIAVTDQLTDVTRLVQARGVADGGVRAAGGGVAAGQDVQVRADGGSVAGAVVRVEGGVQLAGPLPHTQPRQG
ncbi:hypothetical protein [Streptomyces sp. NPDC002324]